MQPLHSQNRINELLSILVAQIKGATAMHRTDINLVSENVLIPLFSEVYGYAHLHNLNVTEGVNYPGIDLGDDVARVAFQITASSDSDKVKETLRKFVEYELYKKYDRLIVYILTEKQRTYSGTGYDDIVQGTFTFNKDTDIQDYRDILKQVASFQIDKLRKIENLLEVNIEHKNVPLFGREYKKQTETVYLNLLEIQFPETIYMAELAVDVGSNDGAHGATRNTRRRFKRWMSQRDHAKAALDQRGVKFGVDWECHERKVITFHDLDDSTLSLTKIIDEGTVTSLSTREFYSIDGNYERVFKSLLRRCVQQKLYFRYVRWQNEDDLFIFIDVGGEESRIEGWRNKKASEREVYKRVMNSENPDKILECKHLAFEVEFKRFEDKWFIVLRPDWFFSYDGYHKSLYGANNISWLKRNENNTHVYNHVQFIAYFLKHDQPSDLFVERHSYPFLSFGELISFDTAPFLDDKTWLPAKKEEDKEGEASSGSAEQTSMDFDEL